MIMNPGRGALSPGGSRFYDSDDWGWQELWLTAADVIEVVKREFDLAVRSAKLLPGGLLNQSWHLGCDDGDRVLRVGRSERTLDHVAYEDAVVMAWRAEVLEVVGPEVLRHPVIDGHVLTLYPFRRGTPGTEIDPLIRARQLAPLMARMHRISIKLDLPQRPGAVAIDDEPAITRWAPVRSAIIERFGSGPEIMEPARLVDQAVSELDTMIGSWRSDGRLGPRAVVHADLNARNQIYDGERLIAIIDTDDCRIEPLIAEVAGLAYSAPEVSPSDVWRDYLAAGGPLDPSQQEMLLPFARLGSLGELEWFTDDRGVITHLADRKLLELAEDLFGGPVRG
jgi:Ser/Thr protein kinase RdoA (MazF antagonist)